MLNLYRFHAQPQQLMGYADATNNIPSIAWEAAKSDAEKRELEHVWAKDPEYAYRYAHILIKKPWPPGEAAIATDPKWAFWYARNVIRKPWPPGEAAIAKDPELAYEYVRQVIKGPWPPGEAAIAKEPEYANLYQKRFKIKLRAKMGQDINQ
jgi:lambda repressor-like predicted transcriptional regulator